MAYSYTSRYPTQDADHVKATSEFADNRYHPYFATNPALLLTGNWQDNAWVSLSGQVTNQRFHIDLTTPRIIRRIYYENGHSSGGSTTAGVENVTFWGSNTADSFTTLTYATDTGWTQLTIDDSTMDQHAGADQADPKYIYVTNTVAYRYYAVKCADNYAHATLMSIRRIELQTQNGFMDGGSFLLNFV